jgi:hypothetical protein
MGFMALVQAESAALIHLQDCIEFEHSLLVIFTAATNIANPGWKIGRADKMALIPGAEK